MKYQTAIIPVSLICVIPFLFICTPTPVNTMRILAIEPVAGRSHWNFLSSVLRVLVENGHNVTVFTPFPEGDKGNYTEIDMSKLIPTIIDIPVSELMKHFCKSTTFIPFIMNITRYHCHLIYENVQMKNILNDTRSNYDIVMGEVSSSECLSYTAAKLNLPLIYLIPSTSITHIEYDLLGHVPNPAVVSNLPADYVVPDSFIRRLKNFAYFVYYVLSIKHRNWTMKINDPQPYDLVDPIKPSLMFVNTHYITEAARPLPPNVIQIGGVHMKRPEGIPKDVLEFIEESPNGVIYFTFGSVVKMSTMPEYILKAFKEALAEVPQRVLWKYENEKENVPRNVMIKKWFPQRDILLHPKVKLFISHGGISGVYETVDAGVPVLGFPFFYDQPRNIANLVDAGMAISMDLLSVTKETILNSILELVNNEKYSINAKIASVQFKDRPMSPEKSIVYWTEYIHRHKGAPHLKSHALNLAWYQYFLLDVIATILICISIILLISHYIIKKMFKYSMKCLRNYKVKSE